MNLYTKLFNLIGEKISGDSLNRNQELKKIGIIRILLGIILLIRFFQNLVTYLIIFQNSEIKLIITLPIIFIVFFIMGVFTPFTNLILLIVIRLTDTIFESNTLGSSLCIHLLLMLLLVGSNKHYSIDNIFRNNKKYDKILVKIEELFEDNSDLGFRKAYSLTFILYAFTSFMALTYHIFDNYWQNGYTVISLFTNSFLSKQFIFFREWEKVFPHGFQIFSKLSVLLQSIFQLLMIPFLFIKIGRLFVIFYGFLFFLVSLFLINLSYLPYIEIFIWLILFIRFSNKRNENTKNYNSENNRKSSAILNKLIISIYLFMIPFFIFLEIIKKVNPIIENRKIQFFYNISQYLTYQLGFDVPNVFNCNDLKMGDKWQVIYKYENKIWKLCPITGLEGERLNYENFDILYLHNHNSDMLYFGKTLQLRRNTINYNDTILNHLEESKIKDLILYDYYKTKEKMKVYYRVSLFAKDYPINCKVYRPLNFWTKQG